MPQRADEQRRTLDAVRIRRAPHVPTEPAVRLVADLGQRVVNFDVNADAGATFTPAQVRQSMAAAGAGSICIGHFNRPGSGTADGMAEALPRLLDGGLTFARLRDVLPAIG